MVGRKVVGGVDVGEEAKGLGVLVGAGEFGEEGVEVGEEFGGVLRCVCGKR